MEKRSEQIHSHNEYTINTTRKQTKTPTIKKQTTQNKHKHKTQNIQNERHE